VSYQGGEKVFKLHWPLGTLTILLLQQTQTSPSLELSTFFSSKSLHPRFRHEVLRIGCITPSLPLELRGLRWGGPLCEEEHYRCLRPSRFGCTSCLWRYVMSCKFHNPRDLTAFDSADSNIAAGHLSQCLCQSDISGFLDSNAVAKKVVDGVGRDGANNYFAELVSGSSFTIARPHDS